MRSGLRPGSDPLLIREYIADQQHYRRLRQYAFFGVACFVTGLLAMFAWWLRAFGEHLFNGSLESASPQTALFITPMIVMASLVAVSLLPTVRLVFRGGAKQEEKEETGNASLALWPTLFSELVDILKSYFSRSKPAS
jgi:hypothetical protein